MNRKDFLDFLNFLVYDTKSDLSKIDLRNAKSRHFAFLGAFPWLLAGILMILFNTALYGIGFTVVGLIFLLPYILLKKSDGIERNAGMFASILFGIILFFGGLSISGLDKISLVFILPSIPFLIAYFLARREMTQIKKTFRRLDDDKMVLKSWQFALFGTLPVFYLGASILLTKNGDASLGFMIASILFVLGLIALIPTILLKMNDNYYRGIGGFLSGLFCVISLLYLYNINALAYNNNLIMGLIPMSFLAASIWYYQKERKEM